MADVNLLYNALAEYHIEPPKQYKCNGFMRWGRNSRYWAKEVDDGYIFGDYSDGLSESIFPKNEKPLSDTEKKERKERIVKAMKEAEAEQFKLWNDTSNKALNIWQGLKPADTNHRYLLKKQVKAYNLRQSENKLVLPLYDTNGKIWSLQYINEDGEKRFLSGGKKKGCYFTIGKPKDNKIIVCEGYATGASIFEATGQAVAIAFDCGNLEPVVKGLLIKYQSYEISIAADNDIKENAPNTGLNEAKRISKLYNINVYIPSFKDSQEKCDFNDLMIKEGLEAVKVIFKPQTTAKEHKQYIPQGYLVKDDGLYKIPDGDKDNPPLKISDKIEVLAEARDSKAQNWSKVVRFKDHDGNSKTILIENTLFAADGRELKEKLLFNGLYINKPQELKKYLNDFKTDNRARCIDKIGWYKDIFVFPDNETIGNSQEAIVFQGDNLLNEYQIKGSLEDWRENISKYCQGNSRLILAVSTAFAGTLLYITGLENGGLHFVGNSSTGKSTILKVACSVYGNKDFLKTWRATDNGLEGIAATRNDTLLVLDELGQVDPNKAGEIAYMLGNGNGKIRSNRNGAAKKSYNWRFLYLSSGEKDLSDCATESKKKVKAGQEIRLLNIPAKPSDNSYGAFETFHDKESGKAFSEYLNNAVREYHGTPARAFINCLVSDGLDNINSDFKHFLETNEKSYLPDNADNQVKRAFNRFMLIAYAGEYATANNITGWSASDSINACIKCFSDWIETRGGIKDQEDKAILEQIKLFFEQNSESRFVDINNDVDRKIINMAGYKAKENGDTVFYVYPETFKKEICNGFNFKQAKEVLYKKDWLENEQAEPKSFKNEKKRVYKITSKMWSDENVG